MAPRIAASRTSLGFACVALALALACGATFAPVCSAQDQDQDQSTIRVDVNLVLLEATVKNKTGQIMSGLKKEDFIVKEDGATQKVMHFSQDQLPLDVALILDVSDSMKPFLGPLHDAASTALDTLKPEDQVTFYTFSTMSRRLVDLTSEKRKIAERIDSVTGEDIGGSTNINGAIFDAAEYLLQAAPRGRRVIVVITDTVATDNGGVAPVDVVQESLAADTAVYCLKVPGDNPLSTRMAAAQIPGLISMDKVAQQTGGEVFDVEKLGSLSAAFSALIERIKTRYTLGYYSSSSGAEGKAHKIDVRLANSFGSKGHDYTVLSKSGYYFIPRQIP
jgi:Ca-activated chloride channel homolog